MGNLYSPAHPELCGRLSLIVIWEKPRQRCWQLWCVLRGMHRCYHSLSYARTIRWKPLPGTVLGLSLLVHRLNTHSVACWHTHTAKQILPWGFSNYPQWMGGSLTHRGPTSRVITHPTKTPHISSDYPIFNFHLWLFFPQRAWGVWEAWWGEDLFKCNLLVKAKIKAFLYRVCFSYTEELVSKCLRKNSAWNNSRSSIKH